MPAPTPLPDAFFEPTGDEVAGDGGTVQRFRSTTAAVGPWSVDALHGGPPSALLVRGCGRALAAAGGGALTPLRVAVDFLSGVPAGELQVTARVVRPGRRVALAEATMTAGGRPVLQARVWAVAAGAVTLPGDAQPAPRPVAPPVVSAAAAATRARWDFPYGRAVAWVPVPDRSTPTGGGRTNPGAVWAAPRVPLLPGEPLTGLARAVVLADSGTGVSAGLDWDEWLFVNVDLTVHLAREPQGEWLLMEAVSRYDAAGSGLGTTRLSDAAGELGAGAQTLMVAPR